MKNVMLFLCLSALSLSASPFFLKDIEVRGKKVEKIDNKNVFLEFDKGAKRVYGVSGCNRFFGAWNSKQELSSMGSTMMACSPAENELERKILSFFEKAKISFSNNEVIITSPKGRLIFKP